MEQIAKAYEYLFAAAVTVLGVAALFALIRAIRGPRIADRIVGVNMIGTITIMILTILSRFLSESYLLDVCIIYAMISFLSVVVLCRIYISVHLKRRRRKEAQEK